MVCGDIAGEGCCELDATDEVLIAEAGIEVEGMDGRLVWTLESFARRAGGGCEVGAAIVEFSVDIAGDDVGGGKYFGLEVVVIVDWGQLAGLFEGCSSPWRSVVRRELAGRATTHERYL